MLWAALRGRPRRPGGGRQAAGSARRTRCPICGSRLAEGERVRTAAYPGPQPAAGGRIVHIYGCPRCLASGARVARRCPVCGGRLGDSDYLIGRLASGAEKGRVHVWGCSRCQRERV